MAGNATPTVYGPNDRPPFSLTLSNALQHAGVLTAINVAYPVLVLDALGDGAPDSDRFVGLAFLVIGIGTIVQALRVGPIGCGLLVPATFTAAYLPGTLMAAEKGGLPLIAGMLMVAGATQILAGLLVRRFRHFVSVELSGVVIIVIGLILGLVGFRLVFSLDTAGYPKDVDDADPLLGGIVLAVMVLSAVYLPGRLKTLAALVGLAAGLVLAPLFGAIDPAAVAAEATAAPFGVPVPFFPVPAFDLALLPEFLVAGIACALRAAGDVTTAERVADPRWKRPDYGRIMGGIVADGTVTLASGAMGSLGANTFSASVGLSAQSGVLSRQVAWATGLILVVMAVLPPVRGAALLVPPEVSGAILMFAAAFIVVNGFLVVGSRALDNRRILVVGFSLTLAVAQGTFANFFQNLPPVVETLTRSGLTVAITTAIVLTLILGIGRQRGMRAAVLPAEREAVLAFADEAAGRLGIDRDAAYRMKLVLEEVSESVNEAGHGLREMDVEISASPEKVVLEIETATSAPVVAAAGPVGLPAGLDDIEDVDAFITAVRRRLVAGRADETAVRRHPGGGETLTFVFDQ